jgi:hypothetical protein
MRGPILLALLLIALSACESPPTQPAVSNQQRLANIDGHLAEWHGHNVNDLIAQNGPPTSTFAMPNGNMMYTYSRTTPMPDLYGNPVPLYCIVHYVVDKDSQTVVAHSFQGC